MMRDETAAPHVRPASEAVVALHDVMPHTLDRVEAMVARLEAARVAPVLLCVVPGRPWADEQLDRLRALEARGYEFAGHGWMHECRPRRLGHRMHAALLSRNVAEHLALNEAGILDLLRRCHAWFGERGLRAPRVYVPPAWAMGRVPRAALDDSPFEVFESLTGVFARGQRHVRWLPLIGFEADTWARQWPLHTSNVLNERLARLMRRPLRISLHPFDAELRLAGDFAAALACPRRYLDYHAAAGRPPVPLPGAQPSTPVPS